MEGVCLEKAFAQEADKNRVQYYMFRSIRLKSEEELFNQTNLSFDITVIPPLELGKEYNKTFGHYHPKSEAGTRYPEIYEVLEGQAHYLIQRLDEKTGGVDDIMLIEARKGDKVVMPTGYGHVSINPTHETLVSANIVGKFQSDYAPYKEKEGAAYFELIDDSLTPNKHYENLPMIKTIDAMDLPINQQFDGDNIYAQFIENPEKFDFLRK
ncbi:TPA: glucose-6-phosphate isomerase [Candidatus Micrarchaeota archaeon]|nr:glucose-6-phosphate isomerase [Candidatus Micrarchaeota archaeon]